MANQFLVSVANAVLRDPNTGNALAYGKANISSAFTMSMQKTEVRGGINNPLLYVYYHDKALEIKIEQATFDKTILGLNAGQLVSNGVVNVTQTDCIMTSVSGSATVTQTPVGNVTVFFPDGTVQTYDPATKNISGLPAVAQKVDAVYVTSVTADQLTVQTTTPPTVVDATLLAEVRDNTGVIVQYLQIQIPRLQISGNYTLSMGANGVSNQALDGMALAVASTDCVTGEYYAKATWIQVSGAVTYSYIAAVPGAMSFSSTVKPSSQAITVLGVRGGLYANANLTTSCSFVFSPNSSAGVFSVGLHTGILTAGSATSASASGSVVITYYDTTNGSLVDTVSVTAY
jgi:hypothetical protein